MTPGIERLPGAIGVAWQASWRVIVVGYFVVGAPGVLCVWIQLLLGDQRTALATAVVVVLYPLSVFIHEAGHVAAYQRLKEQHQAPPVAAGTWRRARIVRDTLGLEKDALVSLAGPFAGVMTLIPVAILNGNFFFIFPWACLYVIHLLALAPWSSDGSQVFSYLLRDRKQSA